MRRRSSTSEPPELVYFTDRDLGRGFPDRLRDAGLRVERHDDHFSPLTSDEEWLAEVGRCGWIAVSHNKRIRYNPRQTRVLMESRVRALVVIGHAPYSELAANFIRTRAAIERFLRRHTGPLIAKVFRASPRDVEHGKPGRVEMWLSFEEWQKRPGRRG